MSAKRHASGKMVYCRKGYSMRVDRMMSIILIISKKGMVTGQELAEHFEVSLRTIYRDIDKLCEAGVPIAANGGKGGGYYLMENYNLDNLFLNKNEIKAIMPFIDNLKFMFGRNQQFNDICLKLEKLYEEENVKDDKFSINISHFSMEEELKEYIYLISKAIEESRLLEFDYVNRRMELSGRSAEPMQITFRGGEWYLAAYCRNREDYRKFKLVRIRNLRLGDSFIKKDISNKELQNIFKEGYDKKSIKVKLKFSSKIGEHLTEFFTKEKINYEEKLGYIVEDFFPHEEGLIKFILGFGKDCEILEPEYIRTEVRDYIKEMKKIYS